MLSKILCSVLFACGYCSGVYATESEVDPLSDMKITCEEMHRYPAKIFGEDVHLDLGSGYGSPTEVDYDCRGTLDALPYLNPLKDLARKIRGEDGPTICTGSIVQLHWRLYRFSLAGAGIAPQVAFAKKPDPPIRAKRNSYFASWASESPSNAVLRTRYLSERRKARPLLVETYRQRPGSTKAKAVYFADSALGIFDDWAFGSFPGSYQRDVEPQQLSALSMLVSVKPVDMPALKKALDAEPAWPQDALQQSLKIALRTGQPAAVIQTLLAKIDKADAGDESALFFALKDKQSLELLLQQGADVNYQNSFGKTALFYAIETENHAAADFLLAHGADPNHAYKYKKDFLYEGACAIQRTGRRPLMHAAQHGDSRMLSLLLAAGAELGATDESGANAMDYAVASHKAENSKFLGAKGLSPGKPLQ